MTRTNAVMFSKIRFFLREYSLHPKAMRKKETHNNKPTEGAMHDVEIGE
jgi:hypothetical protein